MCVSRWQLCRKNVASVIIVCIKCVAAGREVLPEDGAEVGVKCMASMWQVCGKLDVCTVATFFNGPQRHQDFFAKLNFKTYDY